MKIASIDLNSRELSGSTGDLGILLPLALGYMTVCGLSPSGLLIALGIANIALGLFYRLPVPAEPMKVIAAVAIAGAWQPSLVYAAGFSMGIFWLAVGASRLMGRLARAIPPSVILGIQVSLGILLSWQALKAVSNWWALGLLSLAILLILRKSSRAPGAAVVVLMGLVVLAIQGRLPDLQVSLTLPALTGFSPGEIWDALLLAGFSQIPLTAANAIISTAALARRYWPGDERVTERRLSMSTGIVNILSPFIGGMPLCHGAGGLAGKYGFGARTGGANVIEGAAEVLTGLFLAGSIVGVLSVYPVAVVGAMLLFVGLQLVGLAREAERGPELIPLSSTVAISLASNMALGFLAGLLAHALLHHEDLGRSRRPGKLH